MSNLTNPDLIKNVQAFVKRGFTPHFGDVKSRYPSHPLWKRFTELGTELWLDSGSIEDIAPLWTQEFTALTTNNTLLNKEIQRGIYDPVILEARELLQPFDLAEEEMSLEIAFILNAWHALRLVERFDAFVSVEEHTNLADNIELAVAYAHRYYAVCPERFIVKIPFTPAGVLATRRLAQSNVPINHTLGFSARQNYLVARIAQPLYVNVFMGRLNSFIKQNGLGDGDFVGEKATLASQQVVMELRREQNIPSRQIGASLRSGEQMQALVGIDVMTIPTVVAEDFLESGLNPGALKVRTGQVYQPHIKSRQASDEYNINVLWDVDEHFRAAVSALENEDVDNYTAMDLTAFFDKQGLADLFPRWTRKQIVLSSEEGKIPNLAAWADELARHYCSLDSLLNLAGMNSFAGDQLAMDKRVKSVLEKADYSAKKLYY